MTPVSSTETDGSRGVVDIGRLVAEVLAEMERSAEAGEAGSTVRNPTEQLPDPSSAPSAAPDIAIPGDAAAGADATGPTARRRVPGWAEWAAVVVVALVVALVVKTFVVQQFSIPSASMEPTLDIGDRLLVNKLAYHLHGINRGDVVVFARPADLPAAPGQPADLIKRVIALPGETVQSIGGKLYIDGRALHEPYLPAGTITDGPTTPVTVAAGHVFVMGDNRGQSEDSRVFGAISEHLVIGRAFARIWPLSREGFL